MNFELNDTTLRVSGLVELNAVTASIVRDDIRRAMMGATGLAVLEIDMSETIHVDSSGLGALFSVYTSAKKIRDEMILRVLNPRPAVQELFEMCRLHQFFDLTRTAPTLA